MDIELLESIRCQSCGSGEVTEVKTGTFFCAHCETLFRQASITDARVVASPDFCVCGNAITLKCPLCTALICAQCNALSDSNSGVAIATVGYGYKADTPASFSFSILSNGRPAPRNLTQLASDLWLPSGKLQRMLMQVNEGQSIACWSCLCTAVEAVAEAVSSRQFCVVPICVGTPALECESCGQSICIGHMTFRTMGISGLSNEYTVMSGRWCPACASAIEKKFGELAGGAPGVSFSGGKWRMDSGMTVKPRSDGHYPQRKLRRMWELSDSLASRSAVSLKEEMNAWINDAGASF
jgi:hypothetical protein